MSVIKKFLIVNVIISLMLSFIFTGSVKAWDYSGTGGSTGPSSNGGGSWNTFVIGVRATAVDENGKRLTVTVDGRKYTSKSIDYYGDLRQISNGYYASVSRNSEHSVCSYGLCSKPELESGGFNSQVGNYNYEAWPYQNVAPLPVGLSYDNAASISQLTNSLSKLGTQNLKKQADDLFKRLMGQPITYFQKNAGGNCEEVKEKLTTAFIIFEPLAQIGNFVGTASEIAIVFRNAANYKYGAVAKIYNALRVNPAVGNRGLNYFIPANAIVTYSNATLSQVAAAIGNTHLGHGVAILAYGTEFIDEKEGWACNFDYTVDSVCVNCNGNNADNVAYVIKDTSDWNAILNSSDSDNTNVQGYYNKGGDVYCREEYTVYFPNARNQIYVDSGRYFTLNPSEDSWADFSEVVGGSSSLPNLKPVKVKKQQECQANVKLQQGKNESDAAFAARVHRAKMAALSSYLGKNESSFKKNMGTVYFRYNETYKESKYNMNNPEEFREYDKSHQLYNSKLDDANEMLTMEALSSYELPDNYYQYIRIRDGLSMKIKPSDADSKYKNVGIENLPVSFENHGTKITSTVSKAADIQFAYDLPSVGTNIGQAANDDDYLSTEEKNDNIYKQYLSGKYDEDVKKQLQNSSCAQIYGFGTVNFNSCARDRVNDKTPSGGNCISKKSIMGSVTSGYSCMVLTSNDECASEDDANRLGVDWNPVSKICCPTGTKFNPELGKCSPKSGNTCRIENGKYYDFNGNVISKEQYDKICSSDVPPVCPKDECPYGCCPSGECAPMPDGTCPGQGGIDVIYRTIDLEDPFPGQSASNRATGANWCSYNIRTQKIDCKYNNATSNNYIIRERGGHKYGNKVYDENHILYEITLDRQTIKQIREYNDRNKYDDNWIKSCYKNGKACFSKFLREGSVDSKLSGKCKLVSGSNFYDCDKPV